MHRFQIVETPDRLTQPESKPAPRLYAQHLPARPLDVERPKRRHVPKAALTALSIPALIFAGWVGLQLIRGAM